MHYSRLYGKTHQPPIPFRLKYTHTPIYCTKKLVPQPLKNEFFSTTISMSNSLQINHSKVIYFPNSPAGIFKAFMACSAVILMDSIKFFIASNFPSRRPSAIYFSITSHISFTPSSVVLNSLILQHSHYSSLKFLQLVNIAIHNNLAIFLYHQSIIIMRQLITNL